MIRKLGLRKYRLYSVSVNPKTGKRRNLGTYPSIDKAMVRERQINFFKARAKKR